MVEAWEELAAWETRETQYKEDVAQIKSSCARDHPQFKFLAQCRECYGKALDRTRALYLGSKDDSGARAEWLAGRDEFCKELDELFTAAREYRATIKDIDSLVASERKKWYLSSAENSSSIRKALELLNRGDAVAEHSTLSNNIDSLTTKLRDTFKGSGALKSLASAEGTDAGLRRLMEAKTTEEKAQASKEIFFQDEDQSDPDIQKYMKQLDQGSTMNDIVSDIVSKWQLEQKRRAEIAKHEAKIEEFQRAKAAHELQQSKKNGERKDSNSRTTTHEHLLRLPPCTTCGTELDVEKLGSYHSCGLCLILSSYGIRPERTMYCSAACHDNPERGLDAHYDAAPMHDCWAPTGHCIGELRPVGYETGDKNVLCNECTRDLKRESFFCCMSCAELNFRRHREEVHIPERRNRGLEVDHDTDSLVFEGLDYHARDITAHFTSQLAMMREYERKIGLEPGSARNRVWA